MQQIGTRDIETHAFRVTMGYFTTIEIYCVLDPTMTVASLICLSVKFYPNSKPFYVGIEVDIQYAICFNRCNGSDLTQNNPNTVREMYNYKMQFNNNGNFMLFGFLLKIIQNSIFPANPIL